MRRIIRFFEHLTYEAWCAWVANHFKGPHKLVWYIRVFEVYNPLFEKSSLKTVLESHQMYVDWLVKHDPETLTIDDLIYGFGRRSSEQR